MRRRETSYLLVLRMLEELHNGCTARRMEAVKKNGEVASHPQREALCWLDGRQDLRALTVDGRQYARVQRESIHVESEGRSGVSY